MRQFKNFADERNQRWCVFCGGPGETRDHVPSRVLLDKPYPDSIVVVPSCQACNNSFSRDEEYLACLLECALTGSVEVACAREKIAKIFKHSPALAAQCASSRSSNENGYVWAFESERVTSVIVKLARGHVAFEQNEPQLDDPTEVWFRPQHSMTEQERDGFYETSGFGGWPEVDSIAMIRLAEGHDLQEFGWIDVQPERYRYRVQGLVVQIVLREYLAAEVSWE
jgi:hypothetical protein